MKKKNAFFYDMKKYLTEQIDFLNNKNGIIPCVYSENSFFLYAQTFLLSGATRMAEPPKIVGFNVNNRVNESFYLVGIGLLVNVFNLADRAITIQMCDASDLFEPMICLPEFTATINDHGYVDFGAEKKILKSTGSYQVKMSYIAKPIENGLDHLWAIFEGPTGTTIGDDAEPDIEITQSTVIYDQDSIESQPFIGSIISNLAFANILTDNQSHATAP